MRFYSSISHILINFRLLFRINHPLAICSALLQQSCDLKSENNSGVMGGRTRKKPSGRLRVEVKRLSFKIVKNEVVVVLGVFDTH